MTCLAAHGMTVGDVVRLTVYLTDQAHIPEMHNERRATFGTSMLPTSTLLIVSGLALPELLVEIDAVAATAIDETARRTKRTITGASPDLGGGIST